MKTSVSETSKERYVTCCCVFCDHMLEFSYEHDSWYCPCCNEWEGAKECENRPAKPLMEI